MTKLSGISRRDFLNGVALGVAAGASLSPAEMLAAGTARHPYPPALTGLRGTHAGAFEVAHSLTTNPNAWPTPRQLTDEVYDLVVVGGGISGLAAAFMYRQHAGPGARILVLDNHDDFGGHAKRNEFDVDGRKLIGYGGSQSLDSPGHYSQAAQRLLHDIGVETERFYDYFDQDFFARHGLGTGYFFAAEAYGADSTHAAAVRPFEPGPVAGLDRLINAYPLSDDAKKSFVELLTGNRDHLDDMPLKARANYLQRISYTDYLKRHAGVHDDVVVLLRDMVKPLWGIGYDALSALEAARLGMPGTTQFGVDLHSGDAAGAEEPYIFHFPDGNAGIARALVRKLVPAAVPGQTMEDLVTARVAYDRLDRRSNATRIRLNSTVVDTRHSRDGKSVDVSYVSSGKVHRVRARHAIMACYNRVLPYLCPEMPSHQVEAIRKAIKIPLVYTTVALRNWQAFERTGFRQFYIPRAPMMHTFGLDFPVSMGGYDYAKTPADPILVHGVYVPTAPDEGLDERAQHVRGRQKLLELTFEQFETDIVRQMSGALAGGDFDAERDIAGITVNRWPHGYAYEYNELFDPPAWSRNDGPHVTGAAQMGRISIANSDAMAYAYVDGAIDAARRAVDEQIGS